MLQFEECKRELEEQQEALAKLEEALGLPKLREEVEMLEHKSRSLGSGITCRRPRKLPSAWRG